MGLRRKQGTAPRDEATKSLINQGVYRVDVQDHEAGLFNRHAPFSFWSGVKYVTILSIMLWWLPAVGQMIAGYVGGRRTGTPWKAVIAALVPLILIFGAGYAIDRGYVGLKSDVFSALPANAAQEVGNRVPALGPYVGFVLDYLASFVVAMRTTLQMGTNGYLVTIIFAYIGGVMAEQARREVAYSGRSSGVGVSITQPIVHSREQGEPMRLKQREPVSFAQMKRIPPSRIAFAKAAPEPPLKTEVKPEPKAADKAKAASAAVQKKKAEEYKPRSEKEEIRMQHYVEQALRRYEQPKSR